MEQETLQKMISDIQWNIDYYEKKLAEEKAKLTVLTNALNKLTS